ncbi:dienelactone hydrolase family protein [Hymenobacter negativus]|uniref:Dienelactone hydrolase family protein n=1 Tax=Hymenobacter negativus TaxID=2795026 RepID=A0ABS0Q440_9BACT|nr:dienelactone hydrolase family protein [Hymenobacter negativus]MBH8557335.1 dienelactone hydrolase family protein [Hymenobacter negativus]
MLTKKLLTLGAALLSLSFSASAQQMASCCARPAANLSASATEAFAMLASDKDFSGGHDAPLPYSYAGEGKMIEFKTPDGTPGHGFEIKSAKPSNKYLFVIHEWWGLNDYIKKEAATFANEMPDVNVIAVDLYDGKVATTPEEAGKYMGEVKTERAVSILKGAQMYAGPKAQLASIGWCFGGGWSLQEALLGGKQTVGCVMYYGMPEKDPSKLKSLNSDVLGIFATQDKWINPEVVGQFKKDMTAAGKSVTIENYDADHAFANPSNPKFNKEYATKAHGQALAYLRGRFKSKA